MGNQAHRSVPQSVQVNAVSFDPDGKKLWGVVDDPCGLVKVVCWSWPDLVSLSRWCNVPSKRVRVRTGLLCIDAGRRWVVAGSSDTYTKLLASDDGRQLVAEWPSPDAHPLQSVVISQDETLAVSGSQVGTVTVTRIPSGERIAVLQAREESRAHRDNRATLPSQRRALPRNRDAPGDRPCAPGPVHT